MECFECGGTVRQGVVVDGEIYHRDCARDERDEEPMDTPSLQDSDPEGYGAAHNINPWTGERGY